MPEATRHAVAADTIFDGASLHHGCAVAIDGARVLAILPRAEVPADMPVHDRPAGEWLAPGFIDAQVNGGGDILFNDVPTVEGIAAIVAAHRRFGTTALLPTLISDTPQKMRAARAAVQQAMAVEPSVVGIHFEGPFLSPERAGVHNRAMFRAPAAEDVELLSGLHDGTTLVTLAPERVPSGLIARLAAAGVRVALGHSDAGYAETRAALGQGLTGFTHLFNAMRPMASREPGPIAAALEDPRASYGLIVDGIHVAPAMLRLALRGRGNPILVTDAMPPVGGSRPDFALHGQPVTVRDGYCATADGTLAGSVLDMAAAVRNCVRLLGLTLPEALRLATAAPAAFLGLDDRLGRLVPRRRADLVALDPDTVRVAATWVAGTPSQ